MAKLNPEQRARDYGEGDDQPLEMTRRTDIPVCPLGPRTPEIPVCSFGSRPPDIPVCPLGSQTPDIPICLLGSRTPNKLEGLSYLGFGG